MRLILIQDQVKAAGALRTLRATEAKREASFEALALLDLEERGDIESQIAAIKIEPDQLGEIFSYWLIIGFPINIPTLLFNPSETPNLWGCSTAELFLCAYLSTLLLGLVQWYFVNFLLCKIWEYSKGIFASIFPGKTK